LDREAAVGGGIHLLLDDGPLRVHLMLPGSEAVDTTDPLQGLGEISDLLGKKENNVF